MDVWCSSCWVQFRVGAEYPGHLCHEKKSLAHDSEAKKTERKKTKGRYVITQIHHKVRFATAHHQIRISWKRGLLSHTAETISIFDTSI